MRRFRPSSPFAWRLVALSGGRYHAASLSSIGSLEILKRARDAGLAVSASVSINHVTLNENDIGPYRTATNGPARAGRLPRSP